MVISIHQPDYVPYLGYFYKIAQSDKFVFLDDVQFSNDNMHHWNRVKTPQGEFRIKIPVEYQFGDNINQVRTKDELNWKKKHLKTIKMNYTRCKYFKDIFPKFQEILEHSYQNLAEMNIIINQFICNEFGLQTKCIKSSDLHITSTKEDRVIDICRKLNATKYLSGNGARVYQKEENFIDNNIILKYTDFRPFEYPQQWKSYIPNLSVLDYIFNNGFDWEFVEKSIQKSEVI